MYKCVYFPVEKSYKGHSELKGKVIKNKHGPFYTNKLPFPKLLFLTQVECVNRQQKLRLKLELYV